MVRLQFLRIALLLTVATATLACASPPPPPPQLHPQPLRPVDYAALAAAEQPSPPVAPERVHALLINGGGQPEDNYASHLAHIRKLASLLTRAGVTPARISILSSDGDDPSPDLIARDPDPDGSWLLTGTRGGSKLTEATRLESSTVPGFALRPATSVELRSWFKKTGADLRDGDTLLLYVTDHGMRDADDVLETRIVLWGKRASVSVRELRSLLRTLRPGVRVVALMSQCFSGAFAWLGRDDGQIAPRANVCGYFSSRFDQQAYGCYAEVSGHDDVGHSFAFLQAVAQTGRFEDAHRAVLVTDRTPDVPLRTSDLWLQDLLNQLAASAHRNVNDVIDALLAQAWENRAAWEPEIRLLDRIGQTYGFASPRSEREMQALARWLLHARQTIETHTKAWSSTMASATQRNLDDFVAAAPRWAPLLDEDRIDALEAPQRRALSESLLRELLAFTARDGGDAAVTMKAISERAEAGEALAFRTQVRIAALIRMGAVLSSIAGRVYLSSQGEPRLLEAYRALRACEGLTLAGMPAPDAATPPEEPPPPMPSLEEELRSLEDVGYSRPEDLRLPAGR